MEVKEPKTFEEQTEAIINKGFSVLDIPACIDFLKEANYYRLSAYFLPFKMQDGTYQEGILFDRIIQIYNFDCSLRALIFQVVERIEFYLRTQISYYFSHQYGSLGYRDPSNFSDRHNARKFEEKLAKCIKDNEQTLGLV